MDERLKRRLVGASVLVLIVVIFVPELFDRGPVVEGAARPVQTDDGEFSSRIIPLEPEPSEEQGATASADSPSEPKAAPAVELAEAASTGSEAATDAVPEGQSQPGESAPMVTALIEPPDPIPMPKPTELPPRPRPKPGERGAAPETEQRLGLSAWAIQLGSFSRSQNALGLRDKLRDEGYAAFVQVAYGDVGTVTRVFVGPELDRARAEAARNKLESELELDGIVVRFPGG